MNRLDRPQRKALLDSDERWSATFNVGKGRITLTCVQVRKCFYYAMSCCAPQDIFNRKEGKLRALRRLAEELQRPRPVPHSDSYLVGCFDVVELVGVDKDHVRTSTLKAILCKHLNLYIRNMPLWVQREGFKLAEGETWEQVIQLPQSKPKKERRKLIRYTITIKTAYESVPEGMADILKHNAEKAIENCLLWDPERKASVNSGHTVEVKDG